MFSKSWTTSAAERKCRDTKVDSLQIAILGCRGYPSTYGGFETLVRRLAPYLAAQGHQVTVYGRNQFEPTAEKDARVRVVVTRGVDRKTVSTLSYGATSTLHARKQNYDAALVLNPANGFYLPILRRAGVPTMVNVDGLEWQRAKWNRLGKEMFLQGAKLCARYADEIVFDSEALRPHWASQFGVTRGVFIPYGADVVNTVPAAPITSLGLEPGRYVLVVSRLIPENNLDLFMEAAKLLPPQTPIVIVGTGHPTDPVVLRVQQFAIDHSRVILPGHVADQELLTALWHHCGAYWHGHSVGGTNPGLLQAMGYGAPTVAFRTVFNAEVLGSDMQLVPAEPSSLAEAINQLLASPDRRQQFRTIQWERISTRYTWESVGHAYSAILSRLSQGDYISPHE